jgi:hypothetical protein
MPCIPFQNQNLKSYYKTYRHLLPSGPANLTASSPLQQSRPVNNPGYEIFCQAESNGAKFYQKS